MVAINYVNTSAEATNGEGWTKVEDFKTKGTEIVKDGVKFEIISREESKTSLFKRIAVTFVTIITAGLALLNESLRNSFFGKEFVDFAVSADQLAAERAPASAKAEAGNALKDVAVAVKDKAIAAKDKVVEFSKEHPVIFGGVTGVGLGAALYAYLTGNCPLNCTYFFKKAANTAGEAASAAAG